MPSRASPHEHDGARWHDLEEAHQQVIWPGYRTAIERIRDDLSDPERAGWFELTLDGERAGTDLGSAEADALVDSGGRQPTVRRHRRAT